VDDAAQYFQSYDCANIQDSFLLGGITRMRYWWLVLMGFVALSLQTTMGQAQGVPASDQPTKNQAAAAQPGSELPPDAPVITIDGLCANSSTSPTTPATPGKAVDPGCKTVITRAQYEYLMDVLGARPSAYHGLKFAHRYAEVLLFSAKGRELGVEKDPRFQEKVRYNNLEALDTFTIARLQQQADEISDADAEKFYKEHPERFVQIKLLQIAVPKTKVHETPVAESVTAADKASMHEAALAIQKEAAAGGDIEKLQDKAYQIAGDPSVPDTDLGEQVPDQIPVEYRKLIFDLKAGEVSQVTEDDHEYLIFKCAEMHTIPAGDRKKFVGWLRMRDSRQALRDSVKTEYNEQYFPKPATGGEKDASGEKAP